MAGSYLRGKQQSGDIDLLFQRDPGVSIPSVVNPLIQEGLIIGNLTTEGPEVYRGLLRTNLSDKVRRIDVALSDPDKWVYGLFHATGSARFNQEMSKYAKKMGWKLSRKGLVDNNGTSLPANTEEDIFRLLGLQYVAPKDRTGLQPLIPLSIPVGSNSPSPTTIKGEWYRQDTDLYLYVGDGVGKGNVIAGFDMDGTLITTKSGGFRRGVDDIVVLPGRVAALKDIASKGYTVVVFTNQKSRTEQEKTLNYNRMTKAVTMLGTPVILLMATGNDKYRKPNTGMWEALRQLIPGVPGSGSFYCGDMETDRAFAINSGVTFYTWEQITGKK